MPRRWELLAICRLKATDRRGAVEAHGKALVWHVALLAPTELEKLDDKTSHFVSQLVVISVGDLFDPESVLLSRLFVNLDVEDKVVRLVMERVLGVLEDMMHKPVAQKAMELVVEELGRMWGDEYPIKRAKLLVSMLKHEYHSSGPAFKVSPDQVLEILLTEPIGVDTSELNYLLGHHRQQEAASGEDAYTMYTQAQNVLDQLDKQLGELQTMSKSTAGILAPNIRGVIMRERIWLSRIGEVQTEEQMALEDLEKLPATLMSRPEDASLLGRIALHEVYSQFRSDLFLTIAVPMGMTSKDTTSNQPIPTRDALNTLGTAEQNCWKTLQLIVAQGDVTRIRESAGSRISSRSLQT
ncbi:hypothetical protein RSOLAG22IIIB_10660 [Rhizoctonia solani]|uniref:Uncharacterized protein n=1 Tax=Rhizoctonia solani TaxID=456999 RepID=A0A0K6G402_9AGAM|nr:hypothetical protein RSOLAG22IIIB_10660 [Rhizoctonia solani]